jgi:hypothetical protein
MILHDSRFSCMARGVLRLVPYRGSRLGFYYEGPETINREREIYMSFAGWVFVRIIPCYDNEMTGTLWLRQFEIYTPTLIHHRMFLKS